ncbi:MAG: PBP1A family penicillin-binding protein [Parcubacteria group bacterium]
MSNLYMGRARLPRSFMHRRRSRRIKLWIKRLFWTGVILALIFVIYLIGAFAWYSRTLPDPNKLQERNLAQSTKIFDRTGENILYDVHGTEKRTLVKLENIPDLVKWATISAEDKNFYTHSGFNLLSTFKGVIIDPLLGKKMRGGSTLTQQLVKNAILTNERTIERKIKEFVLSYRIEKIFTKDEILQMYLNEIPYGSVSYGVQSASQTFFNKNVQDLDLAEAATIAAIPQAPTYYSPYGPHLAELKIRKQYVLNQMVANGYITLAQADAAAEKNAKFGVKREAITAPHFVMYIKQILSDRFGDDLVENGGLQVTTTLDLGKQRFAEDAVTHGVDARGKQYNFYNAALVALDPKTGQILAMVGSKDYFDIEHDGNFNVALSPRQPGSSIKPMIYAAAFAKGYTPNTVLYDVNTVFKTDTTDYAPHDYDMKERGPVTIRYSLGHSLNTPAVKTLYLVGVPRVLDLLELNGYTTFSDRSRFGLSLVLGGGEVKLLEHTAGYGTLADQGVYQAPAAILKVEDSRGNTLYEYKDNSREVMSKDIANTITDILSDDSIKLSVNLSLPGRPAAAKTGTTNDFHDAWSMGYTPSLVAGVWVGNNDNKEMTKGADGSVIAAPIWKEFMTKALAETPAENFTPVVVPQTGKPILDGVSAPEVIVKIDKYTGKLATDLTPSDFIVEKKVSSPHDILFYVNKDDPTGPMPSDPSADPQYANWEAAVQDWLRRTGAVVPVDNIPSGTDDAHTEANRPAVSFNSPQNNKTFTGRTIEASITASAPRGAKRVEYYIDDKFIAVTSLPPYDLNYTVSSYLSRGIHALTAKAYDDIDNSNSASISFNFQTDMPSPALSWVNPSIDSSISSSGFPFTVQARLTDRAAIDAVRFLQKKIDSGQIDQFAEVDSPQSENVQAVWPTVFEKGEYELYAEITSGDEKFTSPAVKIQVY